MIDGAVAGFALPDDLRLIVDAVRTAFRPTKSAQVSESAAAVEERVPRVAVGRG